MTIGIKIKYLRQKNKWSLQKLADALGCSKAHIFEIERGKSSPTFDKIQQIATIFTIPLSFFSTNQDINMKQNEIMKFFEYEHLPGYLKEASKQFALLAEWMSLNLPDNAEKSAGLRKLLEAKDCAVRAKI